MLRIRNFEITAGFLLLLAAMVYLDKQNVLFWGAIACGCHELGHVAALRQRGARVRRFRLTACGAVIYPARDRPLSYREQILAAAAGPAANFLLSALVAEVGRRWPGAYLLVGISSALGLFNLLPILPLDGGKICLALLANLSDEGRAARVTRGISFLTASMLLCAGFRLAAWPGHNLTLILMTCWLLVGILKKKMEF